MIGKAQIDAIESHFKRRPAVWLFGCLGRAARPAFIGASVSEAALLSVNLCQEP